ncbi:MAG: EamA family transporter [Clostridia bacterium]|nr:EamA family transporter [Clostridia bacterium]
MLSVILIALVIVLYSFQTLFCRLYNKAYPGREDVSPFVYCAYYGVFVSVATFFFGGCTFSPSWQTVLFGLLNTFALLLYNITLIKATATGSYAIANLSLLSGGILIPLLESVLIFDGVLSPIQYAGIFLMLIAFGFLNADGFFKKKGEAKEKTGKMFYVYCALLLLANGAYGAFFNAQQKLLNEAERTEMIILTFLPSAAIGFLMVMAKAKKSTLACFKQTRLSALHLLLCCISATVAINLLVYIMSLVDIAVLFTVENGGVLIMSALYAVILFKEKITLNKIIGLVIAVISMALLGYATV